MIDWNKKTPTQNLLHKELSDRNIQLDLLREDLNHPLVSGNKLRKLKYNIETFYESGASRIVTFGGAHSNHISATAYACNLLGITCLGIIRGEPGFNAVTLQNAEAWGMKLEFVSRIDFSDQKLKSGLMKHEGSDFFIPEGGNNAFGLKGTTEILVDHNKYDNYFLAVGTGNTVSGVINSAPKTSKVYGVNVLKGAEGISNDIKRNAVHDDWELLNEWHLGGYAKHSDVLDEFIRWFLQMYSVQLDPIYTGKMMFGLWNMILDGQFDGQTILAIHTGGLQGISGYEQRYDVKISKLF